MRSVRVQGLGVKELGADRDFFSLNPPSRQMSHRGEIRPYRRLRDASPGGEVPMKAGTTHAERV